ncbi:GerAB/ArcD/ProY family transporter [Cytobacillus sp. IB215316]|uniref:GerAB/ArcD/ProY family transporter n=1 Tax=Cytobacillus sp. IB215316 TaxID=3097354 RepID=UPI002A0FDAD8|nr:GerAB/ArcD/ProY family transporter [Cytobacillus sp. IB215316]MDX8360432.1 GerAB/ArcD/ProY family transporter [Cytobacillus sp. IB215316]
MQEKLQPFPTAILIHMVQSGIILFSLPRVAADAFGTNGWIGVLLISLIVMLNIVLISLVFHFGKGRSIFNIFEDALPISLLRPFYLLLALQWGTLAVVIAKDFEMLLRMLYYPTMPFTGYVFLSILLTYWLVTSGIYHISKATVIFFYLSIWTVPLLLFHLSEFKFFRFTPFVFEGSKKIIEGGSGVFTAFLGYEIILLLFPYLAVKKSTVKAFFYANVITTMVYFFVCIVSFGYFSFDYLRNESFPSLTLLDYIRFPFVERIEGFLYNLASLSVLVTVVMYYWSANEAIKHALPKIKPNRSFALLLIVTFIISLNLTLIREVELVLTILARIEIAIAILLPIILIVLISITHMRRKTNA